MSRSSDLGPLPLNWRDVGLSLAAIQNCTVPLPDGTHLNRKEGRICTESGPTAKATALTSGSITIPAGRLLRSGQLYSHHDWLVLGGPKTVINLRHSDDATSLYHHSLTAPPSKSGLEHDTIDDGNESETVTLHHVSAENSLEKYDTSNRDVARWVASVLRVMQVSEPPILVHCRSGKDRTGVVICAALMAAGVDPENIRREYLLSGDTEERHIDLAIRGLLGEKGGGRVLEKKGYFLDQSLPWLRGVDIAMLKNRLMGIPSTTLCSSGSGVGFDSARFVQNTSPVIQAELAYLRMRLRQLQSVARSLFERRIGVVGTKEIDLFEERSLIDAMITANCRQIEILVSMRENASRELKAAMHYSEHGMREEDEALSRRLAQAISRQGYFRKVDGDYLLAAGCFGCALWLLDHDSDDSRTSTKHLLKNWKRERAECIEQLHLASTCQITQ